MTRAPQAIGTRSRRAGSVERAPATGDLARAWSALAGPLLASAVAGVLLFRIRHAWGDPVVDFGRELYLAWRLSEGAVLYRDVAHFNGPLSPYLNAVWFELLGTGVRQLVLLNLVILGAVAAALFSVCRTVGDRASATVAVVVFLGLQGFGYFGDGTYNFVTPYSHEVTHGLLLGLLVVVAAGLHARSGRARWAFAAGACVGLAFLTKPEAFLAALAAGVAGLGATAWIRRSGTVAAPSLTIGSGGGRPLLGPACAGALLPPAAAFAALAVDLGPSGALDALLRQWRMVFDSRITELYFYRWVSGLDAAGPNLLGLGLWTAAGAATVVLFVLLSRRLGPTVGPRTIVASGAGAGAAVLATAAWIPWQQAWYALPAAAVVLAADAGIRLVRRQGEGWREVVALALSALALALLAKQGLRPRVFHYGFALTVPATALCVAALLGRIPRRLGPDGALFRALALGLGTGLALFHLGLSQVGLTRPGSPAVALVRVGTGPDALPVDSVRGPVLEEVVGRLAERAPGATLAVLPEGAYLNFLLRRPNPTPFIQLMPPELLTWGEDAVVEAYRREPPDLVVLVHRDWSEYGTDPFGREHGRRLLSWIHEHYRSSAVVGDRPFSPGADFGAEIFERRASPAGPERATR